MVLAPLQGMALSQPVSMVAQKAVWSAGPDDDLATVDSIMRDHGLTALPVVDRDRLLCGVISQTDLVRVGRVEAKVMWTGMPELLDLSGQTVREVMTPRVETIEPDAPLCRAARRMLEHGIHRVFVQEDGKLEGVLATHDLLSVLWASRDNRAIRRFMHSPVQTVELTTTVGDAVDRLSRSHISGLVVMDETGAPIGAFGKAQALLARHVSPDAIVEDVMTYALTATRTSSPVYRVAGLLGSLRARRVVLLEEGKLAGIVTGLDLARAVAD
jgi:CBS domain-containing protein